MLHNLAASVLGGSNGSFQGDARRGLQGTGSSQQRPPHGRGCERNGSIPICCPLGVAGAQGFQKKMIENHQLVRAAMVTHLFNP